jgi:hypothetical protein
MTVQNQERAHVGESEDVVIDTADGRIAYVAMDAGLLGPMLAIPWKSLGVAQVKSIVTLNVPKRHCKRHLPSDVRFGRSRWTLAGSPVCTTTMAIHPIRD